MEQALGTLGNGSYRVVYSEQFKKGFALGTLSNSLIKALVLALCFDFEADTRAPWDEFRAIKEVVERIVLFR